MSGGIESHKSITAACQQWWKQSKVRKLHGLWKHRWLAGSKPCNHCDNLIEALKLGQKDCRLQCTTTLSNQKAASKPRIEALGQSIKNWKVNHTFSQNKLGIDPNNSCGLMLHQNRQYSHTPAQGKSRIYEVWQFSDFQIKTDSETTGANDASHGSKHC